MYLDRSPERIKNQAGLASALGLLATTASADIVSFLPDPPVDSGWHMAPLASWNPLALDAEAGNGGDLYPGNQAASMYGCFGNLELAGGNPGGVEFMLSGVNLAPVLSSGDSVSSAHSLWSDSGSGWLASLDTASVEWGTPFYIGYRVVSGTDYLYGYAQITAQYNETESEMSISPLSWAYESTPNQGITAGAVPEPGVLALLVCGAIGLRLKRLLRPPRE